MAAATIKRGFRSKVVDAMCNEFPKCCRDTNSNVEGGNWVEQKTILNKPVFFLQGWE